MNFDEYQKEAMFFRLPSADEGYALLNLGGEVGEMYSAIAKQMRDNTDPLKLVEDVKKEMGDVLWCLAAIAADMGTTLQEIAQGNIQKLTDRKSRGVVQGSGDAR